MKATTFFICNDLLPLSWQYRADRMFQVKRLTGERFTDTLDGSINIVPHASPFVRQFWITPPSIISFTLTEMMY